MFATIQVSPYISIQGLVTRNLPCGKVAIVVRGAEYVGAPIVGAAVGRPR